MKITEIAFSCYPVTDMARARAFYEGVLGLKPTMQVGEPGGMEWTEYGIAHGTLSLGAGAPGWHPTSSGCSVGLEVEDFDAAIAEIARFTSSSLLPAGISSGSESRAARGTSE